MAPLPEVLWQRKVAQNVRRLGAHLGFMTRDHHLVRNLAVREIARTGQPLPALAISQSLDMPLARVAEILAQLERRQTFLFRNQPGEVLWAYPVTAEPTPHRVDLDNGEGMFAA